MFWRALCTACRRLWAEQPQLRSRIAGMAVTTQRSTVVNVDRDGRPLRPAMIWLDQRRTAGQPPVGGLWGLAFRLLRLGETIGYFQAEAEANWIRTHQPEIWAATHKYLLLSGYLNWRLTGRFTDSAGSVVGYFPFDYKRFRWAPAWDWKWRALQIPPAMLPDLVGPTDPLGTVTAAAAEATGLARGLPVVGRRRRQGLRGDRLGQPRSPCRVPELRHHGHHQRHQPALCGGRPPAAALPPPRRRGTTPSRVMIYRGYWMVSWFKEQFGHLERQAAEEAGVTAEALFDRLIEDVPPGAMGLVLQPYWSPGLKLPGPEAKGAVIGFGDVHNRAHLYRAILEGLAYGLREGKERIEKRTRVPVSELRVSGGGSQSRQAMQATARHLRLAHGPAPSLRHLRPGGGHRPGRGPRAAPGYRNGRGAHDPRRRRLRTGCRTPRRLRRALPPGLSPHVPAAQAALRRDPPDHGISGSLSRRRFPVSARCPVNSPMTPILRTIGIGPAK